MGEFIPKRRPIKDLYVEFNDKMWEVLKIDKENNIIEMKCCIKTEDPKVIVRDLDNQNIVFYSI